jgi:hypothetical protein
LRLVDRKKSDSWSAEQLLAISVCNEIRSVTVQKKIASIFILLESHLCQGRTTRGHRSYHNATRRSEGRCVPPGFVDGGLRALFFVHKGITVALNDPFVLGVLAAVSGKCIIDCPFPEGAIRNEWLTGYFLAKPPFNIFVVSDLIC